MLLILELQPDVANQLQNLPVKTLMYQGHCRI